VIHCDKVSLLGLNNKVMLSPFANVWIVERRYNVITTLTSFQSNVSKLYRRLEKCAQLNN